MSFRPMLRPGQGFKPFTVLSVKGKVNNTGRPCGEAYVEIGVLFGIISQASSKEIEQAKQAGHPITHTIIQRGTHIRAYARDVLELADGCNPPRKFIVQSNPRDPGELGHFLIYQVEERLDL